MTVLDDAGLVINWPQPRPIIAWWMNRSADDQRKDSAAQLQALADFFRSARAYAAARQWRATGGETGLPCIEIGRTLRVPRADLDRLLGRHGPSQAVA
mgnify:CR=1 FL=1